MKRVGGHVSAGNRRAFARNAKWRADRFCSGGNMESAVKPEIQNPKSTRPFLFLLMVILLVGGWLRWRFIQTVNPYPDEFVTMLAMDMIRQKGLPILPSGLFYDHGLLYSYIAAGAALLGDSLLWGRLTSLIFGIATVVLTYFVGKRWFSPLTGVLAAAGVAFAPSAIQWSGRVRMYALLQLLVLLALWWMGDGLFRQRMRSAWLAVGAYFAALLTQFVSVALLPALGVAEIAEMIRQKRRWLTDSQFWLRTLVVGVAVVVAFLVKRAGQPKGVSPLTQTNPVSGIWQVLQIYADFSPDVAGSWAALSPFFTHAPAALFGFFAVLTLVFTAKNWLAGKTSVTIAASGFLAIILLTTTILMLFFVAPDRRDDKYLFMLLPVLMLLGARGISLLWQRLAGRHGVSVWVQAGLALVLVGGVWVYSRSQINDLLTDVGEDYTTAFNYVKNHWQDGDALLTGTPAAAYYCLRRNDYYAVQAGGIYDYRILTTADGRQVERWLGSPWVNSVEELTTIFRRQRVWLVLERWGLLIQYYQPLFMQNILAQTEFIREDNDVIVLKSLPDAQPLSPDPAVPADAVLVGTEGDSGQLKLLGYSLEDARLTLYWLVLQPLAFDYTVFVNVQTPTGETVTQIDHRPLGSILPTTLWQPGETIRETSELSLPPGEYHLRVGMYRLETGERLWVPDDATMQNMVDLGNIRVVNK